MMLKKIRHAVREAGRFLGRHYGTAIRYARAFGQGVNGESLTYERVVYDLTCAADAKKAAMDTDHERTADTWSAPPYTVRWTSIIDPLPYLAGLSRRD